MAPTPDSSAEIAFIHDLAGPLSAALFILDSLLEEPQLGPKVPLVKVDAIRRARESVEKLRVLLDARRNAIRQL